MAAQISGRVEWVAPAFQSGGRFATGSCSSASTLPITVTRWSGRVRSSPSNEHAWEGYVDRVEATLDEQTRTLDTSGYPGPHSGPATKSGRNR